MPTSSITSLTPATSTPSAPSSPVSSSVSSSASSTASAAASPPLKICCACPDTRTVRDGCIIERGPEACQQLIEQHKDCLRQLGFKV